MLYIRFSRPVARQPFPSHKAVTSKFRNAFKPECPLHTRCLPPDTNAGKAKETYDSIVVLGGGLREDGQLPDWVKSRLDLGSDLLRRQGDQCKILCLGGGTPHKPAVLVEGHVLHEATACADYLLQKGVAANRVLKETASYDTVGNGYFATTMHAIPAQWRRCAIVTSEFHLPRSQAIFLKCFELANKSRHESQPRLQLSCYGASDNNTMSNEVLRVRCEKEEAALQEWNKNAERLTTLAALHQWLHETHLCYAVSRQHELRRKERAVENPILMASY